MVEFANPLASGMQGLASGVQMGLQIDQARRQKKAQEWENDFRVMSTGLQLAQTKGMSPESQAKILNDSVGPAWKKWTGQEFPKVGAENVDSLSPVIKNINALGKQASEGKMDWGAVFTEANSQIANFHAQTQQQGDVSEKQKAALEAAMAPIKGGVEKTKTDQKGAKAPDEILKEMFDIQTKTADINKLDSTSALMIGLAPESPIAKAMAAGRVSPEQMSTIRGLAVARMRALNEGLPAEKKLQELSPEDYRKMTEAGVSPDEIARRSYVVPGR